MSTKVEAEHNNDLHLHLYWDTTGRFQGAQELQGSLAVLVGQGDHFCLELQENPAKTQTEQIQMLSLASSCKDIAGQTFPFLTKSVWLWWEISPKQGHNQTFREDRQNSHTETLGCWSTVSKDYDKIQNYTTERKHKCEHTLGLLFYVFALPRRSWGSDRSWDTWLITITLERLLGVRSVL